MAELNSNELQQLQKQYENRPMSVGNWFVTILIMAIPVVGLIMLFVWAFGASKQAELGEGAANLDADSICARLPLLLHDFQHALPGWIWILSV